jgi:hypothetical protein
LTPQTTAGGPATVVLPANSNLLQMYVDIEAPFQTAAGVSATEVNVSAAAGVLIARIAVSASTKRYSTTQVNAQAVRGEAFRNVTTTLEAHVSIQGSNSVISAGQGILSVLYINTV